MSKVAIVQLVRAGDLVAILPIAKHFADAGNQVGIVAHVQFSPILEAASYVKIIPYHGLHRQIAGAAVEAKRAGYDKVITTQGLDGQEMPEALNFQDAQWRRAGMLDQFHDLPLVLDKRNRQEEDGVLAAHLPPDDGQPLLAYNLASVSSKYPHEAAQREWIKKSFPDHRLLDLGALPLRRPQLLLPLIERSECLLTVDTLTLHLAYATGTPTIAMSAGKNPKGQPSVYYDSEPRSHWIARFGYDESITPEARDRIHAIIASKDFSPGRLCRVMPSCRSDPIWHVVDFHLPPGDTGRFMAARKTWKALEEADPNYHLKANFLVDGSRSSKDLGDTRELPYIADIIDRAWQGAEENDILVFTNSDIGLIPSAADEIRKKLAHAPCCFSRRVDVAQGTEPKSATDLANLKPHDGADLFAFRAGWWNRHRDELSGFLIGCDNWDTCFRWLCFEHTPKAEITPPIVWHQRHQAFWNNPQHVLDNPGQKNNRAHALAFAKRHNCEAAIIDAEAPRMFKADDQWDRPAAVSKLTKQTSLFVNVYTDPDPVRDAELRQCLGRNKRAFDRVVMLDGRPTLREIFDRVNEDSGPDDVNVVANADIYFEPDFSKVVFPIKHDEAYLLSRWDDMPQGIVHYQHSDSQDAWVFRGHIRPIVADFTLGRPGCDNRIGAMLHDAGYKVSNPSKSVKAIHLHRSGVRRYERKPDEVIPPPYLFLDPAALGEEAKLRWRRT